MRYDIGIDLGGTNIVAGVVDADGNILGNAAGPTGVGRDVAEIVRDMDGLARRAAADAGISAYDDIGSIGVGVPGTANSETGLVDYAPNLYWTNVPLRDMLGALSAKPVYIGNDANAAAYGEYTAGAARGYGSVIAITLGTGIGGGMALDGKIVAGFNYSGMEVGHMVIRSGGRPCPCGRLGCWERYAAATGLIITTREVMEKNKGSALWEIVSGDIEKVEGKTAFDARRAGDAAAAKVVEAYIDDLACGIINVINILQPDIMCVGGGVANEGETLLAPLRERVNAEVFSQNSVKNTVIVKAKLGNNAGIIGAAHLYRTIEEE